MGLAISRRKGFVYIYIGAFLWILVLDWEKALTWFDGPYIIRVDKHCCVRDTMAATQTLSASLEDYLETIYRLVQADRVARVKDIAARLGVQMSSVTGALRSLAAKGLVNHDPYSYTTLTPRGEEIARELFHRHQVLTSFLSDFLGIDPETAERNACHIEHAIEPIVLDRLIDFVESHPHAGAATDARNEQPDP